MPVRRGRRASSAACSASSGGWCDVLLAVDPKSSIDVVVARTGGARRRQGIAGEQPLSHAHRVSRAQGRACRGRHRGHSGLGGVVPARSARRKIVKVDKRGFGLYQDAEVQPVVDFGKRCATCSSSCRARRQPEAPSPARENRERAARGRDDPGGLRRGSSSPRRCRSLSPWRVPTPESGRLVCVVSISASAVAAPRRRTSARGARSAISPICSPGSPKGLESLTLGVAMVLARAASSRLDVATPWHTMVIALVAALAHGVLQLAISSSLYAGDATAALRLVPTTRSTTALVAPLGFRCSSARSPAGARSGALRMS